MARRDEFVGGTAGEGMDLTHERSLAGPVGTGGCLRRLNRESQSALRFSL